jgi:hypothetical protein
MLFYTSAPQYIIKVSLQSAFQIPVTMHALYHLGGVMVSVLAIGPKVRGFKLGQGYGFLRAIKSAEHVPSEGK